MRIGKGRQRAEPGEAEQEARSDVAAVTRVVTALDAARDVASVVQAALRVVRESFGWAYGSYWEIDPAEKVLRFAAESGTAGEEFRRVTSAASFAEGVGLSGRAWKARDLVFVADLGELTDCVRAPAAQRAGVRSGVCFPLMRDGQVVATMDFFTTETVALSEQRLGALRAVGLLVSQAFGRVADVAAQQRAAGDVAAINSLLREMGGVTSPDAAMTTALQTIRREFDWAYGSFWELDPARDVLVFGLESGSAGAEFAAVTRSATFAEGVGLAGRAWQARDLLFVEDLGQVTDCVRAPAARAAGSSPGWPSRSPSPAG